MDIGKGPFSTYTTKKTQKELDRITQNTTTEVETYKDRRRERNRRFELSNPSAGKLLCWGIDYRTKMAAANAFIAYIATNLSERNFSQIEDHVRALKDSGLGDVVERHARQELAMLYDMKDALTKEETIDAWFDRQPAPTPDPAKP